MQRLVTYRNEASRTSLENSLVLDRYRVLWQLDQKKLIRTYIARDEHRDGSGTAVLVKHFLHDLGEEDSPTVATLYDELNALTHLRHGGVVSLLNFGFVGQHLVAAYAHVPGMDLAQLCEYFGRKQRPFPPQLALYIARRLLTTLHHCHSRPGGPLVHGRITLGCIHLPSSGEPQIADFGLASLEDVAAEAESQLGFFQTRMSYSAPEITRGGPPTEQGDTYSMALLLYRLLAGSNPFRGRSIPETLQRVLQLTPAPLLMPGWEHCERANEILMRALSKDPLQRPQTCLELCAQLTPLSTQNDEVLADELSRLVRNNSAADWAQIARLTRAVQRSSRPPRSTREVERPSTPPAPLESRAPAFVSGLLTEQPVSGSEHTLRDRQAREAKKRKRQLAMVPTVLVPAAAIIFGLFLGKLGGSSSSPAATGGVEVPDNRVQLVNASLGELRSRLRKCSEDEAVPKGNNTLELEFGPKGELAQVRLNPKELAHTRLGACLLDKAWAEKVHASSAMSVMIPIGD
jgi:serine/threonine protein kinase